MPTRIVAFRTTESREARSRTNHEENVPAERPAAQKDTRISISHEDEQGPPRPQAATRQGEEKAHRLTREGRPRKFGPDDRARRKTDFDEAYARGVRIPSRYFTFIAHPSSHDHTRLGLTLSRKVGGAVVRNSVRRRLREVFRRNRNDRWPRANVVLHVHPVAAQASYADLEAAFLQAMLRYETKQELRK